jgi:hypothetical protein
MVNERVLWDMSDISRYFMRSDILTIAAYWMSNKGRVRRIKNKRRK